MIPREIQPKTGEQDSFAVNASRETIRPRHSLVAERWAQVAPPVSDSSDGPTESFGVGGAPSSVGQPPLFSADFIASRLAPTAKSLKSQE